MAQTVNLLSPIQALMVNAGTGNQQVGITLYEGEWIASNASTEISSTNTVVNSRYSLTIYPRSSGTIRLELPGIQLTSEDNDRALSANLKIKSNSSFTTNSLLFIDSLSSAYSPHTQTFNSGQYNALQTNRAIVPDDNLIHTATIRIDIQNHNGANIFITLPHLIHDLAFYENILIGQMRNFLPDFYWEHDSEAEYPTYPFFRLMDILSAAAARTRDEHDSIFGYENSEIDIPDGQVLVGAKSSLVSPAIVKNEYIPWLSQFTGEKIYKNIYDKNGNEYFDNDSLRRDFVEWQLSNSHYGRSSGTRQAIIEAARQVLIKTKNGAQSTKSVGLTQQYLGDPFSLRIQTLTNETIDSNSGQSSNVVLQSANLAKPMGYSIVHTTVDEFFLTLDDLTLGRFDQFRFE
jgi:hypothetical protein